MSLFNLLIFLLQLHPSYVMVGCNNPERTANFMLNVVDNDLALRAELRDSLRMHINHPRWECQILYRTDEKPKANMDIRFNGAVL